jgi:O-antigen/teichoic acid export membrane protein
MPTTEIVSVVEQVAFPAFARKARESPELALATYPRYLLLICGLAGPLAAVFAALAQPIVSALLGSAFAAAAAPLAIMCLAGYLRAIVSTAGSLVLGLGRPELDALMGLARAVVLVTGVIVLSRFGVIGAAVASLLSLVVTIPVWLLSLAKVGASPVETVHITVARLPATVTAGIAAWSVGLTSWGPVASLLAGLVAGAVGFLVGIALFDRPLQRELTITAAHVRRR